MRKPKAAPKKPAPAKGGGKAPAPGKRGLVTGKGILVSSASRHHAPAGGTKKTGKHPHQPHHAPAKKAAPKKRKLSPGSDVACCSAEALGTLLGWDWQQVLGLYWRTAADPDAGATIADTLRAYESAGRDSNPQTPIPGRSARPRLLAHTAPDSNTAPGALGLILGVSLPGPHAIAVTPDGTWWSWGQPFDPAAWPDLTIDEAWAVTLP